jgi:hypothetical protein
MMPNVERRRVLRGMLGAGVVTVGVPFLDCFLDGNGTALASGGPLPTVFGSWFQGLGLNPGFWEPKTTGPGYEMPPLLAALAPFRDKLNIYSGLRCHLDGHAPQVHATGAHVCLGGGVPPSAEPFTSIDSLIADTIGTKTRFRSLEVSCVGSRASYSRRSASAANPSETSPAALYARLFGPEFKDPNAADFTPDPAVMARRSVLSGIAEERQAFLRDLGAADRQRMDEYFTALREIENQLALEMQKPAPLEACRVPGRTEEVPAGNVIEDALNNNRLFAALLAQAIACGQTRVFNVMFTEAGSNLRRAASPVTFHIHTHEEPMDMALGYQPNVHWFMQQCVEGFRTLLATLAGMREGDRTLLDRALVLYSTDTGFAKYHSVENMPLLTAGLAGGRLKGGVHVQASGDTVTRVGLTVQQAMGVPISSWGTESNQTSKTFTEVMA